MGNRRYRVDVAPAARRQLAKLGADVQHRIIRALHRLEFDPRPPGVEPLEGTNDPRRWRIRIGEYRVIYEIHDDQLVVLVIRLGHRGEVYRLR